MAAFWASLIFMVLAEMGDKTQLATVALAAKYQSPVAVWAGTNVGMLVADLFGIVVGIVMGKHIPERAVNWGSALVFTGFGIYGIHENVPEHILTPVVEVVSLLTIGIAGYLQTASFRKVPDPEPGI